LNENKKYIPIKKIQNETHHFTYSKNSIKLVERKTKYKVLYKIKTINTKK